MYAEHVNIPEYGRSAARKSVERLDERGNKLEAERLDGSDESRHQGGADECRVGRESPHHALFYVRYGAVLPDDDAGRDDIFVIINHLAMLPDPEWRIKDWLRRRAPWFKGGRPKKSSPR